MKFSQSNSTSDSFFQRGEQRGFWDRASRSQNIMIPIELDQKSREIGFYPITNQDLPVGGQNNLNEITGTPFKVELAGMAIIASPVLPNFKQAQDSLDIESIIRDARRVFLEHRIPVFSDLGEALRAVSHVSRYALWRERR